MKKIIDLTNNGIKILEQNTQTYIYNFKIKLFLFDAVAKASVLISVLSVKIKNVTGYSSCSKCT